LEALQKSRRWVFIGYSLPAADFEIRHLLKTAQLGRRKRPDVHAVLWKDGDGHIAGKREFCSFLGLRPSDVRGEGVVKWIEGGSKL